jgi:hypothetical protein
MAGMPAAAVENIPSLMWRVACVAFACSWPTRANAGSHRAHAEDVRPFAYGQAAAGGDRGEGAAGCGMHTDGNTNYDIRSWHHLL